MSTSQIVQTAIATLGFAAAATAAIHAVLYKRRPQSAFGWIAVCFSLPFVGALLYYLFGINRVRMRARKLLQRLPEPLCPTEFIGTPPPVLVPLSRLGEAVTGWPLTAGNRVDVLYDAADTFNAMIAAIDGAETYVHFATYIFDGGPVGKRFASALAAAAARGVEVRVLLDGVGELYSRPPIRRLLRGTGVKLVRFLPPRLFPPSVSINLRNHRKSLIVDGVVAFTGGVNVRDRYLEEQPSAGSWTCTAAWRAPSSRRSKRCSCVTGSSRPTARPSNPVRHRRRLAAHCAARRPTAPTRSSIASSRFTLARSARRAAASRS
jgi:cardiolipin synthase A/B